MAITLKAARVNAGFTQKDAAELLGITAQTLRAWEKGASAPREMHIRLIERLYTVSYNDLIFLPQKHAKSVSERGE